MSKPYIVSEVPRNMGYSLDGSKLFYCHHRDYPNMPVAGSVGDKAKANAVCKLYNRDIRK